MLFRSDKKRIWCDVGCGVGHLLTGLKENYSSWEGVGIEADPSEIQFAQSKGLKVVEGFINPDEPEPELIKIIANADVVSMINVLEHIERPDKMIAFYAMHMKKGAYLVIEVPRHPSLSSFSNLVAPDLAYRHIVPPTHLQIFSEKAMEMLTTPDFCLLAQWGFGLGYNEFLTQTMLLGQIRETTLYQQLMDIGNDIQKVIDERGFSDMMIYVYEK